MQDKSDARKWPIRDERIVEAIESCRPGSDDVSDPALAYLAAELAAHPELDDLYERCQQLDLRLAAAFADVPIPEGLAGRILARIEAAGTSSAGGQEPARAEDDAPAAEPQRPAEPAPAALRLPKRRPRRWFAWAVFAAGVAAAVLVGVMPFRTPTEVHGAKVLSAAIDFFSSETREPGELLTAANKPVQYPFPRRDVNLFAGATFRPVSAFAGFPGCDGVAYDLTNRRLGVDATLYVLKCEGITVTGLPAAPPSYGSTVRTSGCLSAAWQSGDLTYVLVIGGSQKETYESFLPILGPVT